MEAGFNFWGLFANVRLANFRLWIYFLKFCLFAKNVRWLDLYINLHIDIRFPNFRLWIYFLQFYLHAKNVRWPWSSDFFTCCSLYLLWAAQDWFPDWFKYRFTQLYKILVTQHTYTRYKLFHKIVSWVFIKKQHNSDISFIKNPWYFI